MFRLSLIALVAITYTVLAFPGPSDDLTPEKAKMLVPEAAGGFAGDIHRLWVQGDPAKIRPPNGDSLTWVLLQNIPDQDAPKKPVSFRLLNERYSPTDFFRAISGPKDKDGNYRKYVSIIQAEFITQCTCKVDGNSATGTVTFKAERLFEGKVDYLARKKGDKWRIEEFRLPDLKITLALSDGGT